MKRDWSDPLLTGRNRVLTHTPLGAWADADSAASGCSGDSPFVMSLNGVWKFALTRTPEEMPAGFDDPQADDAAWHDMPVPSNWQLDPAVEDQPIYTNVRYPFIPTPPDPPPVNPTGWYRREFDLPSAWSGREVFLCFASCDSACKLWVNGVEAGYSQDSKLPHEFNITAWARPGRNRIAVMVPRYCDGYYLECQDYWQLSGIQRDVTLYSKPPAYIRDFVVRTTFDAAYRDAELFAAVYMSDVQDLAAGYQVEVSLLDADGAPVLDAPVRAAVAAESPMYGDTRPERGAAQFRLRLRAPRPWTAETPYLYTLVMTLINPVGKAVDFERCRTGFRQIEIRDRMLQINGKRMIVRGVNVHEHHPVKGRALDREDMRRELVAMKQLNFNAVRTCHYPKHSAFYDLCDELGLYVVDEANLETHGVAALLSKDPLWMNAYMERAQRMALRDRNHPSIVVWSLGNESSCGPHHAAMAAWLRFFDPTRPVQYEGGFPGPAITDVMCPMYPKLDWVRQTLSDHRETRPMILCEYAYAKGNGGGNFKKYWDLVDEEPSFQGGFIWDWSDKALTLSVNGRDEWVYGNAFDGGIGPDGYAYGTLENPQMCLNGIVFPDLVPKPAAFEIKQVQGPVQALAPASGDVLKDGFTVWNKYIALDLSHLELQWTLTADGRVVHAGSGALPAAGPGEKVPARIDLPAFDPLPGTACFLNLDFVQREATPWCAAGHGIGWAQFAVPSPVAMPVRRPASTLPDLAMRTTGDVIELAGPDFAMEFSRADGTIRTYSYDGKTVLKRGPQDLFFRARTDNDYMVGHPGSYYQDWLAWGLDRLVPCVRSCEAVRLNAGTALIRVLSEYRAAEAFPVITCETQMQVLGTGDVIIRTRVVTDPRIAHLPRIGLEMTVDGRLDRLAWFGRGPWENYVDRKSAARVGLYRGTVDEQFVPYIDPCECGGKEDVRWLTLTDADGGGLLAVGMPLMHADVQRHAIPDLVRAGYQRELTALDDVLLHLDHRHMGIGGDTGWTRNVHEEYMIRPGIHDYAVRLRGLKPGDDAWELVRTAFADIAG